MMLSHRRRRYTPLDFDVERASAAAYPPLEWRHDTPQPDWWNPYEGNTLDPTNQRLSQLRRDWIVRRLAAPTPPPDVEHRHMPWGQVPHDPCFVCGIHRIDHQ
jgi:hypothetical protein